MNYIDLKYINLLSPRLARFKKKSITEYNFRCPFCGDSQKSQTKARGWIIEKKQESFYYCHNCNISKSLYSLIDEIDTNLSREYYFEKFKSTEDVRKPNIEKFEFSKPVFNTNPLKKSAISLSELPSNHIAIKYVESRKIPKKKYDSLFYIDKFNKLDSQSNIKDERLIIPYYNMDGKLTGFTGRALGSSGLRYANVSYTEEQLFYGLREVDLKKDIYIVEGAIDSMFLGNSIAVNNSNLSRVTAVVPKEKCILIPDKEPRNKTIINNIEKFINLGFRISLIPHEIIGKDINEYVLNGTKIHDIINDNIYCGMRAKLKLTEWKRI
ncbi:MAG: hypothetical protein HN497_00900 [Flavobacteriaceae bacterium]|nr:hypothetical protein [Flavobacteriaceae bacterium]